MPRRGPKSARTLALGGALTTLLAVGTLVGAPAVGLAPASAAPAQARSAHHGSLPLPASYYVALGDSLSQGMQPATPPLPSGVTLGDSIDTDQGYADDLFAHYKAAFGGTLQVVKLGCPGETTTSMLTGAGSPCAYPQGSQLAAALAYIRAHPGEVKLITIDIGANDVDGCLTETAVSEPCFEAGLATADHDLPLILGPLRAAAGKQTVIAGMNLYDPFLAGYRSGAAGKAAATESVTLAEKINQLLAAADRAIGANTADVQNAFSTANFTHPATLSGVGTVPLNVARTCEWTWMCAAAPVGPNIHANAAGYQVIAGAFEKAISPRLLPPPGLRGEVGRWISRRCSRRR
jgi:lysophospholipase L1-like esterase